MSVKYTGHSQRYGGKQVTQNADGVHKAALRVDTRVDTFEALQRVNDRECNSDEW